MTTILVVDDVEDTAEMLAMLFDACGHEAHVAHNGVEAFEQARRCLPQIVFLDLDMPVLDGFGAARLLRDDPDTRDAFIVALTAKNGADVQARVREAGFDVYLQKPADTNALLALVDDLADRERRSAHG